MSSLIQITSETPSRRMGVLREKFRGLARGRFRRSLGASVINTGGSQVIRLAGNLILTRLLFPEAFGLMAMVNVVLVGLEMFSDLGIGASVVQRRERPGLAFLQTAWTLQVFRGIALWIIASAVAWPLAHFYREPSLAPVLMAAAFTLVLVALKSPAIHLCARNFRHGDLARIDLISAVVGLLVSIGLAYTFRSVWALVAGGIAAAGLNAILSWWLPEQVRVRFRWDPRCRRELIGFGRWILVATIFAFLAAHGDRLLLARFLTFAELGVYTVAFFFAQSVTTFLGGLSTRTLFPVLSRLENEDPQWMHYRRLLLAGALVPLAIFLIGGPLLIEVLYDARYEPAGSLLQWLALAAALATLRLMAEPVLLARGDSYSRMWLGIAEAAIVVGASALGGLLFGLTGFLFGYVAGQFLTYLPMAWLLHRHRAWTPRDDAAYVGVVLLLAALGWALHPPVIDL